jgi:hypothetical protein
MPYLGQKSSPGPSDFTFASPSSAETELRAVQSFAKAPCSSPVTNTLDDKECNDAETISNPVLESTLTSPLPRPPAAPPQPSNCMDRSVRHPTLISSLPKFDVTEKQPARTECMRIIATFLRPGAPKELALDATVRDTVIRNLASNSHPDVVSTNSKLFTAET